MHIHTTHSLDDEACYRALVARDPRFDGQFFVGVTSTGVYCRPVCKVRTPQMRNCRFFELPAQAEHQGFRPCLRCRPELAPAQRAWSATDATDVLVQAALKLLDEAATSCAEGPSALSVVSDKLGISGRHLRRIFQERLGLSPLAHLQTRRLLNAKQLLTDTELPIESIAHAAGFRSVRRFNELFLQQYGLAPSRWRQGPSLPSAAAQGTESTKRKKVAPVETNGEHRDRPESGAIEARMTSARSHEHHFHLRWRSPARLDMLTDFFIARQIDGIEVFDRQGDTTRITRSLYLEAEGEGCTGWLSLAIQHARLEVQVAVSPSLQAHLPIVVDRVRHWLDIDADPAAIHERLRHAFPGAEGIRLPGAMNGFELAVRAVLGQQITVKAARTLASRLVQAFGRPIKTPHPAVNRLFPSADALLAASADELGSLGVTRQRQNAIRAISSAVQDGSLTLQPGAHIDTVRHLLEDLPGIGPWTAAYIAMRSCGWADAWLPGDVALAQALGMGVARNKAERQRFEASADAWRPWRAYAVLGAWAGLYSPHEVIT